MYDNHGYSSGMLFSSNYLILVGIPLLIALWAQFRVSGAFKKWGAVRASSNITGAEAAREILQAANIRDVEVAEINDYLGDHYDPTQKRLCLSSNVYNTPSVAALGIAAHETGHAIQHAKAYAPLKARYTEQALAVMRAGDARVCERCGPRPEQDAEFCSKCGAALIS